MRRLSLIFILNIYFFIIFVLWICTPYIYVGFLFPGAGVPKAIAIGALVMMAIIDS
jgi:hypothetical protein